MGVLDVFPVNEHGLPSSKKRCKKTVTDTISRKTLRRSAHINNLGRLTIKSTTLTYTTHVMELDEGADRTNAGYCWHPCGSLGVLMQLDDADAGDVGKEKDARADAAAAPPCGMTRLDEDSDRRQREKDDDDALGRPFRGADVDAPLLGATTFPMLRGAGAAPTVDGDDGHHVERDTDTK
jgi:hypothetical protein